MRSMLLSLNTPPTCMTRAAANDVSCYKCANSGQTDFDKDSDDYNGEEKK